MRAPTRHLRARYALLALLLILSNGAPIACVDMARQSARAKHRRAATEAFTHAAPLERLQAEARGLMDELKYAPEAGADGLEFKTHWRPLADNERPARQRMWVQLERVEGGVKARITHEIERTQRLQWGPSTEARQPALEAELERDLADEGGLAGAPVERIWSALQFVVMKHGKMLDHGPPPIDAQSFSDWEYEGADKRLRRRHRVGLTRAPDGGYAATIYLETQRGGGSQAWEPWRRERDLRAEFRLIERVSPLEADEIRAAAKRAGDEAAASCSSCGGCEGGCEGGCQGGCRGCQGCHCVGSGAAPPE